MIDRQVSRWVAGDLVCTVERSSHRTREHRWYWWIARNVTNWAGQYGQTIDHGWAPTMGAAEQAAREAAQAQGGDNDI